MSGIVRRAAWRSLVPALLLASASCLKTLRVGWVDRPQVVEPEPIELLVSRLQARIVKRGIGCRESCSWLGIHNLRRRQIDA